MNAQAIIEPMEPQDDTPAVILSEQQDQALAAIKKWLKSDPKKDQSRQIFYLAGYAGTGKTTIAIKAARMVGKGKVLFAAFTGKAALVMQSKGCKGASTIHSLIYNVNDKGGGEPTFSINYASDLNNAKLLIVDECSMVGQDLGSDLLLFGVPILVLGDPAQLPPVKDAGFFTLREPNFLLTEIHRQARESAILRCATYVREGGTVHATQDRGYEDLKIISKRDFQKNDYAQALLSADMILCGINRTRVALNNRIRALQMKPDGVPVVGDKVICLRNNHKKKLLNGSLWIVKSVKENKAKECYDMFVYPEDGDIKDAIEVSVLKGFFEGGKDPTYEEVRNSKTEEFTFGNAVTVHKSQGSQWDNLILVDESRSFSHAQTFGENTPRKWLYTGITRAAKKLTIVAND
jgi:exodeoxyribonuclease-5